MWYKTSNGDSAKPATIDQESSKVYTYIRRDFQLCPAADDVPEHWEWAEKKVTKDEFETIAEVMTHGDELTELETALCDVYEMIGG